VIFPIAYSIIDAFLPEMPEPFDLLAAIRDLVTALVLATLLWAFHRWLPAHRDHRPALWPGILFTLVLWHFAAQAFSWYLSAFADYTRYYAGLAGIVAALLFFYIAAVILLFAAALNRAIHEARRERLAARKLTGG
jgi:membrane protein